MVKRYTFYDCPTCHIPFLHRDEFEAHVGPCAEKVRLLRIEIKKMNESIELKDPLAFNISTLMDSDSQS